MVSDIARLRPSTVRASGGIPQPSGVVGVLLCQAEDSEFEKVELVFAAITASLIREANRAAT